eukprot:scaffold1670_cov108-Isochrysis_galbana.AAC.7
MGLGLPYAPQYASGPILRTGPRGATAAPGSTTRPLAMAGPSPAHQRAEQHGHGHRPGRARAHAAASVPVRLGGCAFGRPALVLAPTGEGRVEAVGAVQKVQHRAVHPSPVVQHAVVRAATTARHLGRVVAAGALGARRPLVRRELSKWRQPAGNLSPQPVVDRVVRRPQPQLGPVPHLGHARPPVRQRPGPPARLVAEQLHVHTGCQRMEVGRALVAAEEGVDIARDGLERLHGVRGLGVRHQGVKQQPEAARVGVPRRP